MGRLLVEGGYYHLFGRGLERRFIFRDDEDKLDFLERLGQVLHCSEAQCIAWAIMSNHYHLLVRVHNKPLGKMMLPLLGGFAGHYNRRHKRAGYVFQNRYKSILCDADNYLLELIRYIHLNPVRAGMLPDLDQLKNYPWTGHAGMLGCHLQKWHAATVALGYFGSNIGSARASYKRFVGTDISDIPNYNFDGGGLIRSLGGWESLAQQRTEHVTSIGDERILGDSQFVAQALEQDKLAITQRTLLQQQGWTLDKLVERVCGCCEIRENELLSKARANNLSVAKSLICYLGKEKLGLTCREIAIRLGISQQAVSLWIAKANMYCTEDNAKFEDILG